MHVCVCVRCGKSLFRLLGDPNTDSRGCMEASVNAVSSCLALTLSVMTTLRSTDRAEQTAAQLAEELKTPESDVFIRLNLDFKNRRILAPTLSWATKHTIWRLPIASCQPKC